MTTRIRYIDEDDFCALKKSENTKNAIILRVIKRQKRENRYSPPTVLPEARQEADYVE